MGWGEEGEGDRWYVNCLSRLRPLLSPRQGAGEMERKPLGEECEMRAGDAVSEIRVVLAHWEAQTSVS